MSDSVRPSGVNSPPKYCRQKRKGKPDRAYVRIGGKKVSLGQYGTAESKAKYAELIAKGEPERPDGPLTDPTISELILAYLAHAQRYYRTPDGSDGREYELTADVCKPVRRLSGSLPASKYGPKRLKEVRQELIDAGLSRKYINKQIDRVRRMFRWGAGEELIPASVPQSLSMVTGLRKGRTDAKELPPVRPVAAEAVEATLLELPEVLRDMVQVQRLTGMRPGELVIMRPQDIDRSGQVWLYTLPQHKTEWRGHQRTVAIGPRAQAILLRYLARSERSSMIYSRATAFIAMATYDHILAKSTTLSHGQNTRWISVTTFSSLIRAATRQKRTI